MVYLMSLYFAFRAARNIPTPLAVSIIRRTNSGRKTAMILGYTPKYIIITIKMTKAMLKSSKKARTGARGAIKRGKYTLDIRELLLIRLFPELTIALEK